MSIIEQAGSMTDASGPVGAQLARARAAHGLSIDDVCRRTNIRPGVVSALERDDIGPSGGAVYARGHVRSLAQALGLQAGPLLAAFDSAYGTGSPPAPVLVPDTDAAEVSLRSSGPPATGPRWPLVMAGILVVVIAIAIVQLVLPGAKHSTKPSPSAAPPANSHRATRPASPAHRVPSLVFPVPAQGVTLRIVLTTKPSWLDITDQRGVELIQRVVGVSDQPLDLTAAGSLRATIGDASAAQLSCNGHPLGTLGGPRQVVTLFLTRGDRQCPAG
jgi:cytoskeleton protein RodZ